MCNKSLTVKRFSNDYSKLFPKSVRKGSQSSHIWLLRQVNDPYVEKAKMMNYRCRSAFKLLEIDDKFQIIKHGDVVLDCGAAPGSWTQVAAARTNANGREMGARKGTVISIDLQHFHPVEGAKIFGGMDFTALKSQLKIKDALNGRLVNCVLSDMAPNATGVRMLDTENILSLCYSVFTYALLISNIGANIVLKVWDSENVSKLERDMKLFYNKVKRIKPKSSRSDSAENFLVGKYLKKVESNFKK